MKDQVLPINWKRKYDMDRPQGTIGRTSETDETRNQDRNRESDIEVQKKTGLEEFKEAANDESGNQVKLAEGTRRHQPQDKSGDSSDEEEES